ncbi:MAG: ABC transporter permease [Verrucomicrobiota bacterium]
MIRFLISRILQSFVVLICILTITFLLVRAAPGSPFQDEKAIPDHVLEKTQEYYGLDKPWPVQLWKQFENFFIKWDGGPSFSNFGRTVNEMIWESLPVSLFVGLGGFVVALGIGIPFGLIAASRKNTRSDYALMSIAMLGICLPTFVTGPLLSAWFGTRLDLFNTVGWFGPMDWVLPAVTLGLFYAGYFARLTRAGMLEVLSQDFIRTARAKGLSERRVLVVHSLKGGLLPALTFAGPAIAGLIGGSFVVETVFDLPGLGRVFIRAVTNRDMPVIIGSVLVYGTLILVMNLLVDVGQAFLNPKLRDSVTAMEGGR